MQAVLIVLAVGTATTWLLGEQLGTLFTATLPFHTLHAETLVGMVEHVFSAPTTYVALAIIGVAAIVWLVHGWFVVPMKLRDVFESLVEGDFGFGWLNTFLSQRIRDLATIVLPLQTGKLNWNIVGILIGLISILLILGVRP